MVEHRRGALRVTDSSFVVTALTDDGRVVSTQLEISHATAHVLRHVLAAHLDPASGRRRRAAGRSVLERALTLAGGALQRIEVHHGDPARFVLVVAAPTGCMQRVDLDLVELTELVVRERTLPIVAVGWPEGDWDEALDQLLRDRA